MSLIGYNGAVPYENYAQFVGYLCTAIEDGTVTSITVKVHNTGSGSGNINLGIYNDNAGAVGTHIAHGTAVAVAAGFNGDKTINVSASIISGNKYWLVVQCSTADIAIFNNDSASNTLCYKNTYTFGTWEDNPSLDGYLPYTMYLYATYTPATGSSIPKFMSTYRRRWAG